MEPIVLRLSAGVASDFEIGILDPVHAEGCFEDEDERAFQEARSVIVEGWGRAGPRTVEIPADPAVLRLVWRAITDLANDESLSKHQSRPVYEKITRQLLDAGAWPTTPEPDAERDADAREREYESAQNPESHRGPDGVLGNDWRDR